MTLCMIKFTGFFLLGMFSLSAVEIPIDESLHHFSLNKGMEVWLKDLASVPPEVVCCFVGQDPMQGKPHFFPQQFDVGSFEEELPGFLDYCEEELQQKGGALMGLVAVGSLDVQELRHYLEQRYAQNAMKDEISEDAIQIFPTHNTHGIDVLLNYPTILSPVQSDLDLKKLWVFYLVQAMAENRFKKAVGEGQWLASEETKHLLPTPITVGHGIDVSADQQLLKNFLEAIQLLKIRGFTENELADSKSQLIKHIKRFYETHPSAKTLVNYYASHMAASIPCPEYAPFMTLSLHMIPEISMVDIAEMINSSFKDNSRQVIMRCPETMMLSTQQVEETLAQFVSDNIECKYEGSSQVSLVEGKDPFIQLPISDEEQRTIRWVIQTVAENNPVVLGARYYSDLEDKRKKLLHIHPLRSLAAMASDPYTRSCLGDIMESYFKRSNFIGEMSKRLSQEASRGNLNAYVPGFCLALKINPDQVRHYIHHKKWQDLVKYVIKTSN